MVFKRKLISFRDSRRGTLRLRGVKEFEFWVKLEARRSQNAVGLTSLASAIVGKSFFGYAEVEDVEGDVEVEVEVELTTFGRESRGIYDFWTRESWNGRLLDARVVELTTFGHESRGIYKF